MEYFFKEGCYITELHNSEKDPAVSVARARVTPGVTTRWHRLNGITERYIISAGQGLVEVGNEEPKTVGPGDTIIIPPFCRQRITNTGSVDLIFLAVCTPCFREETYEDLELPFTIIEATAADAEAILALQKRAFLSQAAIYDNYQLPPLTQSLASIEREFQTATFLKAVHREKILGAVRFMQNGEDVNLERLVVEPSYQNRGIGARLLTAVESRCPKGTNVRLFTGDKSTGNLHLYQKAGYRESYRQTTDQGIVLVHLEKVIDLQ